MNHDKYELTHKMYLKAIRELDEVRSKIRAIPWRKLEEPYQHGWNLFVVLREDFARSAKGPIVEKLIERFGVKSSIRSAKLVGQIRRKPEWDSAKRLLFSGNHYYGPSIIDVDKSTYEKLSPQEQKYFILDRWRNNCWGKEYYIFALPSHYLMLRVEKRIITHTKDLDPVLQKREAELKRILEPYWRTCSYGEGYYHWVENRKERRKGKHEIMEQLEE